MGVFVGGIAVKGENEFQILEGDQAEEKAMAISLAQDIPVLSAYIYDGDYWGYTLYENGCAADEFCTLPEYFEKGDDLICQYTADVALLSGLFEKDREKIERYLVHWTEPMINGDEDIFAYSGDEYPYGDVWQMVDFLESLGFAYPEPWAFREEKEEFPALSEILCRKLPPREGETEEYPMIDCLPSAFSDTYIENLINEQGIKEFQFEDKNPKEIIDIVMRNCFSVQQSERDAVCQRLHILAGFCAWWLRRGNGWGYLDKATYEPVVIPYEKPTDVMLLRARAQIAPFYKRNRAIRDLNRLMELDAENIAIYRAELEKWEERERLWRENRQ